jgi:hypothetical protein
MTEPLTMAGGASRSVKFLHLTTILAPERDLLKVILADNLGGRGVRKIYHRAAVSTTQSSLHSLAFGGVAVSGLNSPRID